MATINGDAAGNSLVGTAAADTINGLDGNDNIDGNAGDDILNGGDGFDFIRGRDGNDFVDGGASFDTITWTDRTQAMTVTLNGFTNTAVSDDGLETDTFERIEGIFATNFGDVYNVNAGFLADEGTFVSIRLGAGNDIVNNSGAATRVDYRSAADGVTIDLGAGISQSTAGGDAAGVGIDALNGIDRARGSSFDDIIRGSNSGSVFQQFEGREGDDFIDGIGGTNNEARYRFSGSGADANLTTGTASDGTGGTDTLVNIQHLEGSELNDVLTGDAGNNRLRGRNGDDTINGLDGDDTLEGGGGNDTLNGGSGSNTFRPGTGDDVITGGDGFDTGDYRFDGASPITFVMSNTMSATGAGIGTDTFTNMERFKGGGGDDTYTVDALYDSSISFVRTVTNAFNAFEGGGGDDVITGNNATRIDFFSATGGVTVDLAAGTATGDASVGSDTFTGVNSVAGSSFDDVINGSDATGSADQRRFAEFFRLGQGDDTLDGRGGFDVLAYNFENNGVGITADLTTGTVTDGFGDTDTFFNIEGLVGSDFVDALFGDDGDNFFRTEGGDDTLDGRGGVDIAVFNTQNAGVNVNLAAGTADDGEGGTDTLVNIENAEGSVFDDILTGDNGANLLIGNAGVDVLSGGIGDDLLDGGADDDTLNGGAGKDLADYSFDIAGVTVNLVTNLATDGTGDTDTLVSIEGALGTRFDDDFDGGNGADTFIGGEGADDILGRSGADVIQGGAGNDDLFGNGGDDFLSGGDGDDVISGGSGADKLNGGLGDDRYIIDNVGDTISDAGGIDTVTTTVAFTLGGGLENLTLVATSGDINGTGNSADNTIAATDGANLIRGGGGNDTVFGRAGDDILIGQGGDDVLDGGAGRDFLRGNDGADTMTGGAQNDVLTGENGDDNLDGGANTDKLVGGVGVDTLNGGSGNDRIFGNSGDDIITGGAGNDVMTGQFNVDTFVFGLGSGIDTITDFATGADKINLAAYGFADFAAVDAVLSDINGRAQINMNGNQDVLRLNGVLEADLSAGDFILA